MWTSMDINFKIWLYFKDVVGELVQSLHFLVIKKLQQTSFQKKESVTNLSFFKIKRVN